MTSANDTGIVLYHYSFSPYARRVVWYLALRGISYAQCIQPPILPRPDLNMLGVNYRRIPVLAIGRDIYLDTRLILTKLEAHFPCPVSTTSDSPIFTPTSTLTLDQRALSYLLARWTASPEVSAAAAGCIPTNFPVFEDVKFVKDREELFGRSWKKEDLENGRATAVSGMLSAFEFVEGLFGDGRQWILGTKNVSIGDIEAIRPFHWLTTMPGALPPVLISPTQFPETFNWISRFDQLVKTAQNTLPPITLNGPDAAKRVLSSDFVDIKLASGSVPSVKMGGADPSGLKPGDEVSLSPTDTGVNHKDVGKLVWLDGEEIVLEKKSEAGVTVRIHAPRHAFKVVRVGASAEKS